MSSSRAVHRLPDGMAGERRGQATEKVQGALPPAVRGESADGDLSGTLQVQLRPTSTPQHARELSATSFQPFSGRCSLPPFRRLSGAGMDTRQTVLYARVPKGTRIPVQKGRILEWDCELLFSFDDRCALHDDRVGKGEV